jgi:hypothetical protein
MGNDHLLRHRREEIIILTFRRSIRNLTREGKLLRNLKIRRKEGKFDYGKHSFKYLLIVFKRVMGDRDLGRKFYRGLLVY